MGKGQAAVAYYYFEAAAPGEEGNPLRFSGFEKSEEKRPRSAAARRVAADRRSRRGQGYLSCSIRDDLIPSLLDILRSILNKDVSTGSRALIITLTVFRSDHYHLLSRCGGSSSSIQIIVDFRRQLRRFLHFFGRSQSIMGQILATVQDKLHGRQWKEKQIRKITDRVFDHIKDDSASRDALTFEEVYIAVLCVYNDINKHLPGPHHDPPSKEKLRSLMKEYDVNLDGLLDREEFTKFIRKLTNDTLSTVSQNLIIALVLAPTVALLTKRATEGVPGVGKVVQRLPNSVYATVITLGVILVQKASEGCE